MGDTHDFKRSRCFLAFIRMFTPNNKWLFIVKKHEGFACRAEMLQLLDHVSLHALDIYSHMSHSFVLSLFFASPPRHEVWKKKRERPGLTSESFSFSKITTCFSFWSVCRSSTALIVFVCCFFTEVSHPSVSLSASKPSPHRQLFIRSGFYCFAEAFINFTPRCREWATWHLQLK